MKILNLSLDKSILDKNSKTAKRIVEYGDVADKYAIVIPSKDSKEIRLSEKVFVYGSGGGNKICQLFNLRKTAKKLLKQGKFDVLTVQDQYYLALIGLFLARKFKIGLELQIHGFEKYSGLRKIIAKFVIPRANAIRCVSERLKRQLVNDFGIEEEKITAIPIYSETQFPISNFQFPNKHQKKNSKNNFIFLTVGRLAPVKNINLQIKAMAEAVKNYPNAELWIIGEGQERKKLEKEIENCKLQNSVKLLGWKNNPEEFYQQADAFLLTSNYEGWGMVVAEAAGYGLPIIMTDVGCAGELIENEKSGLVIPVNDHAKLEEAMARFINDENLRKNLAEGAFSAVKNLPSKEETMALYKQSWEKAIKRNKMKLLIITQKVDINDDLLGIYHEWVKRIAAKCESVIVVCLYKGEYDLPENVKVLSLGKEKKESNFRYLFNFYKYIWRFRKQYDTVFVHMNPEYVILGGLFWKIWGKKVVLWYAHYLSNLKLKVAIIFAGKIVTSIRQAFPLKSRKLEILQQGIDTDKFSPKIDERESASVLRILSLGRISPVKKHEVLIDSAAILKERGISFCLTIAGEPTSTAKDRWFYDNLVQKVKEMGLEDMVNFIGKVPNIETPLIYNNNDIFVNLTPAGSFDKTILEAMACGLAVIVSNKAYKDIFGEDLEKLLIFKEDDEKDMADKILNFVNLPEPRKNEIKIRLRNMVVKNHNLDGLINKLIYVLKA